MDYRVAIITASDKGYAGEREDLSGPAIKEIAEQNGFTVVSQVILPDDEKMLSEEMIRICDCGVADLLLTTGGTGFADRDVTPEATMAVVEKLAPGIPEAMRTFSLRYSTRSMLSRAVAGIRGKTLIVNLPGSPKAVKENLEFAIDALHHGVEMLKSTGSADCARK